MDGGRALTRLGILAGLASAGLLGLTPIFGKLAMRAGLAPIAVVALRTALATLVLLVVIGLFQRRHLYIYTAGLLGCLLAGALNGLGSLLYYAGLGRLDASLASMLYALYPVFTAGLVVLGRGGAPGPALSRLTLARLGLAAPAVLLLAGVGFRQVDWIGAAMMLGASLLYAMHLLANQHVLFDMPAPTVTLYTLMAMTLVVAPAQLLWGGPAVPAGDERAAWPPLLALTAVTLLSRLAVFFGVKRVGGLQTAMLGLGEMVVSVVVAGLWLGDALAPGQWIGAGLLLASLVLVAFERDPAHLPLNIAWLRWIRPPQPPLPPEVAALLADGVSLMADGRPRRKEGSGR
jgi:drug/metabolite transporter (DMT)-like permease